MKEKTAAEKLIELIPSGAEIKTAIFEGDMDEKMLDEWLWERIFKGNDFLALEKEQMKDFYDEGKENEYQYHINCKPINYHDIQTAEQYYNTKYNPKN